MATKNISITEEAYDRLASFRKGNESFSKIILKVTKKRNWKDYFGILSDEKADQLESNIRKLREKHKEERTQRIKRISQRFG